MSKRRRPPAGRAPALSPASAFWGRPDGRPPAAAGPIRPTADPDALPRSLGDPPLAPRAAVAQRHLGVVYEEAVRAAKALAAASGLLADEEQ